MTSIPTETLQHLLCVLLLVSRLGDLGTTYLATPTLALEANPIIRKFGWRFAILTIGACLLPYVSLQLAVAALMPFLLVSASNAGKIWVARTMGEQAYASFLAEIARKSRLAHALWGVGASCFFVVLAGGAILLLYPSPMEWGFWVALGVIAYAVAIGVHGTLWFKRLFRGAAVHVNAHEATQQGAAPDERRPG